jgi:hypothetical protein
VDIRTPPAPASGAAGAVIEDRISEPLAAVVATARRRASLGGDREVDTAHLLHGLLESDAVVRAFLGGGGPQTAKLLGYLAQRSIGYGLRWRDAALTADPECRAAHVLRTAGVDVRGVAAGLAATPDCQAYQG